MWIEKNKIFLFKIFDSFIDTINDESKFSYYFTKDKEIFIELLKKNLINMKFISNKKESISIQNIEIFIDAINNQSLNLLKWILDVQKLSFNKNILNNISLKKIKENRIKFESNDYPSLLNILIKLYEIKNNIEDKTEIIDYFLSDNKFNQDSFYLTFFYNTIVIKEENLFEEHENDNILNLDESIENKYNDIIEKNNNKYLIENLIYFFEIYHENKYFKKELKANMEKDDYSEILGNISLKRVIYAYDFYDKKYLKSKNIKFFYMIGYLKIYFKFYVKIIYKCKNKSEFFDFKSIKDQLNLEKNSLETMKNLHLYILKLLLQQCQSNEKEVELMDFINDNNLDYLKQYCGNVSEFIKSKKKEEPNYFRICYEIPTVKLLKERIDPNKNPLLNISLINKDKIYKLNKIPFINKLTNIMLEFLNYKKSKDEIKNKLKDEKEIIEISNFKSLMEDYIKNYNSLIEDSKLTNNNYENYSLDYFIIDKNNDKNSLYKIYKDFIINQNNFIESLNNNNSKELNEFFQNIEIIYVQDANEADIPKIIDEDKVFETIIKNGFIKYSLDSNNDENFKKVDFDIDRIEKILIYDNLFQIKKFYPEEYGIRSLKYIGEVYEDINDDIINDYRKQFNKKTISEKEQQSIIDFVNELSKKDNYELLLSLQYLMIHILSLSTKSSSYLTDDKDIKDIVKLIPQANAWIKFDLLKKVFNIKEEGDGNNGEKKEIDPFDFDFMAAFNNNIETQKENNYKLNQLISIFDICKNLYVKKIK